MPSTHCWYVSSVYKLICLFPSFNNNLVLLSQKKCRRMGCLHYISLVMYKVQAQNVDQYYKCCFYFEGKLYLWCSNPSLHCEGKFDFQSLSLCFSFYFSQFDNNTNTLATARNHAGSSEPLKQHQKVC